MVITNLGSFFSFSLIMHTYTLFMHEPIFSFFSHFLFGPTISQLCFHEEKKRFTTCCFGYTFHTAKSTCSFPLSRHSTTWRASYHSAYSWNIKWQKCAHIGLNGFHIKWIIGIHCNWKNQNPGSRMFILFEIHWDPCPRIFQGYYFFYR